jgi:hypothetical protein
MVVLGLVGSRIGHSRNGRVRNGRSRIGRSRNGTSTVHVNMMTITISLTVVKTEIIGNFVFFITLCTVRKVKYRLSALNRYTCLPLETIY